MMRRAEHTIIPLTREQGPQAAGVLALAFAQDPLTNALFAGVSIEQQALLREFFTFSCAVRFDLEWPLLGCLDGDKVIGVLGVTEPEGKAWPESLAATYRRFTTLVGPVAHERMERYATLADQLRPTEPNFQTGVIGVHPDYRGQGVGRALLDAIQALSEAHPASVGVSLDTESEANVAFYRRCGYEIANQGQFDGVPVWCMMRHNRTMPR